MTQRGTRFMGGGIQNTEFANFWMDKVEQAPSFFDDRHDCKRTEKGKEGEGSPPAPTGLPSDHWFFCFFSL